MTTYYNKRYYRHRTNWNAHHTNKRNQLTSLFGGIDKDIESIFLNLDRSSLEFIFHTYGKRYGANAENYARKTFLKWKDGTTRLSGQTAERLLNHLPPLLTQTKRYELIKKLRDYYMKLTQEHESITTSPELWKQDLIPIINRIVEKSSHFKLPEGLKSKASWLSGGDVESANKILASVEQEEAKLRTAYLEAEFFRIDQYINIVKNTKSVSHTITIPQGTIQITIKQKKKSIFDNFGGGKMKNDRFELIPKEELERALVKQQSRGELLNLSFNDLTERQKDTLRERVINERVNLEVSQHKADQRFANSSRDMENTIRTINALEQSSKSDYEIRSSHETASGSTNITVKKNNNTVYIVVAIVIGIIIFLFLKR